MVKKNGDLKKTADHSKATEKPRIPLRITDTTLRDGHQSLWATRMRTHDIMGILDVIDSAGYYSLEVWGGATFDVCLRFLRENPWERLRQIKAKATKTPLQMLLRGQNILGYKNYPDDLLDRFIALACQNGVDIFRIFDALNDTRNLEHAIASVKRNGGHAQGTLCYTISAVHTVEEYVRIAKEQIAMGVDSLCIKDMAGILSPISAEKLITALAQEIKVPIQMHCHTTSGMATATYVEAVRAGAGAIDCAISPMAGYSSLPPVETMLSIFDETTYHANLDIEALRKICKYFTTLAPKRQPSHQPLNIIDPEILIHHIPGGMISNLRSQLEQQNALDKLNDVLAELPQTRADLGYPPLVTPTSQIVGVQAVLNVLSGERYKLVTQETKDYVRGLYGRSPVPIKPAIRKKILGKEDVVTCRPADLLPPMLPSATNDIDPKFIKSEEDIISFCLFPEPAMEYFKWRDLPDDEKPATPAELERKQQDGESEKKATTPPPSALLSKSDYEEMQKLLVKVKELQFSEFTVRRNDLTVSLKASGISTQQTEPAQDKTPVVSQQQKTKEAAVQKAEPATTAAPPIPLTAATGLPTIDAPLNGTFYTSSGPGASNFVKEGDLVKADHPVCIVEAMKLLNQIKAPFDCKIVKIVAKHGQAVQKGDALIAIEKS